MNSCAYFCLTEAKAGHSKIRCISSAMQTPSQWVQTCAIQTSAKMVRAVQAAACMRRRACDAKSHSAALIYLAADANLYPTYHWSQDKKRGVQRTTLLTVSNQSMFYNIHIAIAQTPAWFCPEQVAAHTHPGHSWTLFSICMHEAFSITFVVLTR